MPEAPEVERIVGQLYDKLVCRHIVWSEILGDSSFIKRIKGLELWSNFRGLRLREISRRGKMIWFDFGKYYIVCSLGMTGSFRVVPSNDEPILSKRDTRRNDRFCLTFSDRDDTEDFLVYNDPRKFGYFHFMTEEEFETKLKKLGPDLFEITKEESVEIASKIKEKRPKLSICEALMNQSFVAGIGNYIKCEALYLAKIHPCSRLEELTVEQISDAIMQAKEVAKLSLKYGGNTIKDYVDVDGNKGTFSDMLNVYGKEYDTNDNRVVKSKTPDGRTSHIVPEIQGSYPIELVLV